MNSKTKICGLLGYPIEHSVSPQMHNAGFLKLGLNYIYLSFPVHKERLKEALDGVRALNITGLNVTTPHKITIMKFLDELDERAEKIGSVNTVLYNNGRLKGFNTDGIGALRAIGEETVEDRSILILGAGGAARAIAYALSGKTSKLSILNRDENKARNLSSDLQEFVNHRINIFSGGIDEENLRLRIRESDIIINATTVGMYPHNDESMIPNTFITGDKIVFDAVYNPIKTKLLKDANAKGARTIYGFEMLLQQGLESFRIWTGEEPPIDVMREAILKELK